jgi:hypothetical protein
MHGTVLTRDTQVVQVARPLEVVAGVGAGIALQIALAAPFLAAAPKSYLSRAFEFSRCEISPPPNVCLHYIALPLSSSSFKRCFTNGRAASSRFISCRLIRGLVLFDGLNWR